MEKNSRIIKEKNSFLIIAVIFYGTVFALDFILTSIFNFGRRDLVYRVLTRSFPAILFLGYLIYLWRDNLKEFLKRSLLAVPFAILFGVFLIILTQNLISAIFSLSVYLFLLFKTENWKQHFLITLTLAFIMSFVLKFSISFYMTQEKSLIQLASVVSIVFIGFIYCLYLRNVLDDEVTDLNLIITRIFKFTCTFCLYFAIWLFVEKFRRSNHISLPVSLMFSGVISIVYLWLIYHFDLMPIKRKNKDKRKNELVEKIKGIAM